MKKVKVITIADAPGHDTIGVVFKGHDGKMYLCDSWEDRAGFWMTEVDRNTLVVVPGGRRTNVSERAIGRTFHRRYYEF